MKPFRITKLELVLIIGGPIILRPIIVDNLEYFVVCMVYGAALGVGSALISDFYGDED